MEHIYALEEFTFLERRILEQLKIEVDAYEKLPSIFYKKYNIIPIAEIEGILLLLIGKNEEENITIFNMYLSSKVKFYFAEDEDIREMLNEIEFIRENSNIFSESDKLKKSNIAKKVNTIISQAIYNKATDIHLNPTSNVLEIIYRINGSLKHFYSISKEEKEAIITRVKVLANLNIAKKRIPQQSRFKIKIDDREVDFRASTFPTIYGEKIVLRILDSYNLDFEFSSLGMEQGVLEEIKKLIIQPYGLILLTGPSGSGKTTSIYTILNKIKSDRKNIITIEDPVEYRIDGIVQSQVDKDIGYTFNMALQSILRQDPDVIMIGEIREDEVAKLALRYAITGHLVLSTIHTNDTLTTVIRLLNMGLDSELLFSGLIGVISQRLVRRLCDLCKEEDILDNFKMGFLDSDSKIYKPVGCSKCRNGFVGRFPLVEIFSFDSKVRDMMLELYDLKKLEIYINETGLITLKDKARELLEKGVICFEDYLEVSLSI